MASKGRLPLVRRARADLGFVDALEAAFAHIQRAPATGSPRWAHELHVPGLRSWPCTRYPCIDFCLHLPDRIEVWRVLHGKRDIPAWLRGDDESGLPMG